MMLLTRLFNPAALAALLLSVACSGEQGIDAGAELGGEARQGLVAVSYEHDWLESQDSALLTATAQFVRYNAADHDQVARLLALPLDPRSDLPALDRCQVYDLSIQLGADDTLADEPGTVELLEAGDLEVETEGSSVTLYARHFPGLLPFISGVTYGEAQATMVDRTDEVRASSSGGESVGPFAARVPSPALPRLFSLAGNMPSPALELPAATGLDVQWEAGDAAPGTVTYLALRHSRGKRDLSLRCQVRDDGAFTLPGAALAGINGRVRLEVARLRLAPFSAIGLDRGELRVTVKDSATLILR